MNDNHLLYLKYAFLLLYILSLSHCLYLSISEPCLALTLCHLSCHFSRSGCCSSWWETIPLANLSDVRTMSERLFNISSIYFTLLSWCLTVNKDCLSVSFSVFIMEWWPPLWMSNDQSPTMVLIKAEQSCHKGGSITENLQTINLSFKAVNDHNTLSYAMT